MTWPEGSWETCGWCGHQRLTGQAAGGRQLFNCGLNDVEDDQSGEEEQRLAVEACEATARRR